MSEVQQRHLEQGTGLAEGVWGRGAVEALLVQDKQLKGTSQPTAWSLVSEPDSKLLKVQKVQAPHNISA